MFFSVLTIRMTLKFVELESSVAEAVTKTLMAQLIIQKGHMATCTADFRRGSSSHCSATRDKSKIFICQPRPLKNRLGFALIFSTISSVKNMPRQRNGQFVTTVAACCGHLQGYKTTKQLGLPLGWWGANSITEHCLKHCVILFYWYGV